jgi:hypothetical protein
MMRWLPLLLILGCGVAKSQKGQKVNLYPVPKFAKVYLNGFSVGSTPLMVELSRKKEHTIVFEQQGFTSVTCTLASGGVSEGGAKDWVVLDVMEGSIPAVADISAHCIVHTRRATCIPSYLRPK